MLFDIEITSADPERDFSSRMEDDWKLANRLASRLAYWKGLLDQNHVTGMCAIFDLLPNKKGYDTVRFFCKESNV